MMKHTCNSTRFFLVGISFLSLAACSGGGGGGGGGTDPQYNPSWTLTATCKDPVDGDSEVVAGSDVQFIYTLNNTSSSDTPALSLVSASDSMLGDISAYFPSTLTQGEQPPIEITYTTSKSGTIGINSDVVYQLTETSKVLSKTQITSCNVIYPDPDKPSEFPLQEDFEDGNGGNDSASTATSLTLDTSSYHTIYPVGDEDWMAATLEAGVQYEFSVDNVSYNGVPKLELYESDGTTEVTYNLGAGDESWGAWGYYSFNPRVTFTPASSGTYYVRVYDLAGGIASYTFSLGIFSDSDGDGYSLHYDCDDTNASVWPWAVETANDTIDQSCSGYDWPVDTASDSYEPDDSFGSAGSLPMLGGDPWDIIHRSDVYVETHTIDSGDKDYFKVTVPAYTAYEIMEVENTGTPLDSTLYASDQTTVLDFTDGPLSITHWLDNSDSATATDYYLEVVAQDGVSTGAYVIGVSDGGTDTDNDGYFTRSQGSGWDCDDNNAAINAGEVEIATDDGIDSNCNGDDAT